MKKLIGVLIVAVGLMATVPVYAIPKAGVIAAIYRYAPAKPVTAEELEDEYYYDSLELLACCVEAEAEDQPLEGKKLVVDVILNRVENPCFPDNIWDVIVDYGQFEVVMNNRIYEIEPSEESYQAVIEELQERTDYEVLYFSAGYCANGEFYKKVGDHYFGR